MKQQHSPIVVLIQAMALASLVSCASDPGRSPATTAEPVQTPPATSATMGLPTAAESGGIVVTSTVVAVDVKNRLVTLRGEDGQTATYHVNDEVRNLPQVKVGDQVVIEYFEGLALTIVPTQEGLRQRTEKVYVSRAQPGQKPSGKVTRVYDIVAKVQAIDTQRRTVTVRGVEKMLTLKASKDVDLNKIKVGDNVLATYEESVAISVRPAAAR